MAVGVTGAAAVVAVAAAVAAAADPVVVAAAAAGVGARHWSQIQNRGTLGCPLLLPLSACGTCNDYVPERVLIR